MSKRTKWTALLGVILFGAILASMCAGVFAADNATVSVSAKVSSVLQLTMDTAVDFGGGDLTPGTSPTDSVTATVNSNKVWSLKVHKTDDLKSGGYTIPSTDLKYTSTSSDGKVKSLVSTPTEFSASDASVCSGCERGNDMSLNINYNLTVPWDVEPGTYTATHIYTATQP